MSSETGIEFEQTSQAPEPEPESLPIFCVVLLVAAIVAVTFPIWGAQ